MLELGEVRVRIEGQPNEAILAQVLSRVLRCIMPTTIHAPIKITHRDRFNLLKSTS